MLSRKLMTSLFIVLLMSLSSLASAASFNNSTNPSAQAKDPLSGKYEGVAKSDQMGDIPLTVEIKNDAGKLSGKIDGPQGQFAITGGNFDSGKIVMKFDAGGNEGTVTAMLDGDKITGKWELSGQGGPLELKRAGTGAGAPAASAPPKKESAPAAAGDPLTGDWDGNADAQGTSIPFTLKLKLEGDKVTGTSEGGQGAVPLTKGTWTANKLSFTLDIPNTGSISMTATIKDGKLVGDFDLMGQMTGKWEATKKKN